MSTHYMAKSVETEVDNLISVHREGRVRRVEGWRRTIMISAIALVAINVITGALATFLMSSPVPALLVLAVPAISSVCFLLSLRSMIRSELQLMPAGDRWFVERLRDASIQRIERAEDIVRAERKAG